MSSHDQDDEDGRRRSAHDLLQSVAIMQALIGTLRANDSVDERGTPILDLLQREVQLVADVCQSEIEERSVVLPIDLGAVARDVVERSRLTFAGEIGLEAEPAELEGDPVGWHRCLYNLVENACRAATDGGKVEVRVWIADGSIRIAVGDSGPGFGEAVAGRASLGLTTVTHVVESHSGHLELRDGPLGGAQVTVVVPLQG